MTERQFFVIRCHLGQLELPGALAAVAHGIDAAICSGGEPSNRKGPRAIERNPHRSTMGR